ncbi:HAD-IA family hydrolase [Clostridium thermarum]|uniref:HAD-IA family hydrolase n=1 Tax=Clostridium thermarum TaxID=1716543 RepID=UPI0013D1E28D|nr:HAD-IA family hydrolase [Clostridium thermarum]
MFKEIIWDFDGTLFDTYPGIVYTYKHALDELGIEEDEEAILELLKRSAKEAIEYYRDTYKLDDRFIHLIKKHKETEIDMAKPFPYAEEVCRWIVESGRRNYILTHRGNTTQSLLKRYNSMERLFTEIITKQSGFKRKPDPEGYAYLIYKYKMKKEEVLIVGDRELEILAAKALGVKVCLYDTNKIKYMEKPDYVANSLQELKEIILNG